MTYLYIASQQITTDKHTQLEDDSAAWGGGMCWLMLEEASHLWLQGSVPLLNRMFEWFLQARSGCYHQRRKRMLCNKMFQVLWSCYLYRNYIHGYVLYDITCVCVHVRNAVRHDPRGTCNCTVVFQSLQEHHCLHLPSQPLPLPLPLLQWGIFITG